MRNLQSVMTLIFLTEVVAMAEVPEPWTPVKLQIVGNEVNLSVWGRSYRFQNSPLPSNITILGDEMLSAPMRLVGQTDAGALTWTHNGVEVWKQNDEQVTLLGWLQSEAVIANFVVWVEFDGLVRIDLRLVPPPDPKAKLQRLWLEIPLRKEQATLFHYWPGRWGSAENSGAVPENGLTLPFKPILWLGWEDGGLTWFAESDKGWQVADVNKALEVVPDLDAVTIRLHFLDSPPKQLPLSFTFGIQATPVKPMPKDFHEWRICHGAFYGMEQQPAVTGSKETILDKAARLGVKTLVFHEHWTPVQNYWQTNREAELRRLITECHNRKIKLLLYFGYELSTLAPEWNEVAEKVLVKTPTGGLAGGYFRQPAQRDYIVCLNSEWSERLLKGIINAIDHYGFDGVYLDGTIEPFACANEQHGCGYRTADGSLRVTYPIFAVRNFMRRLYEALHPKGKLINAHQSTYCGTPTLSFVHSYWDGEQFGGGELAKDPLQKLPLASFRAEFMGKNFGVPCEFLVYERPPDWTIDHALAFTMLHDVRVRPLGFGEMLEKMAAIWDAMTKFGVSESEWYPYWRNSEFIQAQPENVKVSGYRKIVNGQTQWLLVISNLSVTETVTAQVQLNVKAIKSVATAQDVVTGEKLAVKGGVILVPLHPMRMRLVLVK